MRDFTIQKARVLFTSFFICLIVLFPKGIFAPQSLKTHHWKIEVGCYIPLPLISGDLRIWSPWGVGIEGSYLLDGVREVKVLFEGPEWKILSPFSPQVGIGWYEERNPPSGGVCSRMTGILGSVGAEGRMYFSKKLFLSGDIELWLMAPYYDHEEILNEDWHVVRDRRGFYRIYISGKPAVFIGIEF